MKILLCIVIAFSSSAHSATLLEKGSTTPYKGLLFSVEEAQNIKNQLVELDYTRELNQSLNKSVDLFKVQIKTQNEIFDIYQSQNDKLEKSLRTEMNHSQLEKIGYFFLGVLTTTLVVYAAK